jgi:hypothetical protein
MHQANLPDVHRQVPILLFGMPRSGTTWIGKIFDSHPDVLYRHEPDSYGTLNTIPMMATMDEAERWAETVRDFYTRLPEMRLSKISGSTPIFPKSYYTLVRFNLYKLSIFKSKVMTRFVREWPVRSFLNTHALEKTRIVWKSIESLGRMGVIARALPQAKGVQILRHPCGFAASYLRGYYAKRFGADVPFSEDAALLRWCLGTAPAEKYSLTLDMLQSLHPIERLAWIWAVFNEKAYDEIKLLPNCMTIRYEDVCHNPLIMSRQLFDFCELAWSPQTEKFLAESTSRTVDRYYSIVKDPVEAAEKWRKQLVPEDIERVMNVVSRTEIGRLYLGNSWAHGCESCETQT